MGGQLSRVAGLYWRVVTGTPASISIVVVVVGVTLWAVAHQPLAHDCAFHGAAALIVKDESGFRMVPETGSSDAAQWELRWKSLATVNMEPRFDDGTWLDPVRTLEYRMGVGRRSDEALPDERWIREEFSKVVAQHPFCMMVCSRSAGLVKEGDGPTCLINWGGCLFHAVFWSAVVGLVGRVWVGPAGRGDRAKTPTGQGNCEGRPVDMIGCHAE